MKPIRLAILRCDGHAYWYACLMAECDMLALRHYVEPAHRWYSDPNTYSPEVFTVPRCLEFQLVKCWDAQTERAERFQKIFLGTPQICRTVDEAIEDIDAVFIANCNSDGSDHLKLARPFLEKGIPIFVDKPFALEAKDAKAMVDLARRHDTPLMSTSILNYVPELPSLRAQMKQIGTPRAGIVTGPASSQAGFVHTISLAQAVFGTGVEAVAAYGASRLKYLELHYPNGLEVLILNVTYPLDGMTVEVFGDARFPVQHSFRSPIMHDPSFTIGAYEISCLFRDMVRTRQPPIDYDAMIEVIAIGDAARRAQREGRRVLLSELN